MTQFCTFEPKKPRSRRLDQGFFGTHNRVYEGVEVYGRTPFVVHQVEVAKLHHF